MPQQEIMHRPIPIARILVKRRTIPPRAIKAAIRKARNLREDIQQALPDDVPREQLLEQHGKQHVAHDPRELFPALIERHARVLEAYGLDDNRVEVRLRDDDHDPDDAECGCGFLGDVPPIDAFLARVFEVVNERWQARPLYEVVQGEISRVHVVCGRALAAEFFVQDCDLGVEDAMEGLELLGI